MRTMMALRAHARGGPETLVLEPAPRPVAGPGEVLVAVAAAGITFTELEWDETWTRAGQDRTPTIPAHEVSGTVAEVGDGVTGFRPGDEVYGLVPFDRDGAAAEYVLAPASGLAVKPAALSHAEAAAMPLGALTAWQALVDHARLAPGERVLVHGGAGAVGAFVVQLAVALGADVTATALGSDADFVKGLGAGRVIDFQREVFDADGAVYDVVVDTVGGAVLDRSFDVLRPGGRLINLRVRPSQAEADRRGVAAIFFVVSADRVALTRLAQLADSGRLRVTVAGTFPLTQGRTAFETGRTVQRAPGKTVLIVG